MANGFHGTADSWERITKPLTLLDPELEAFGNGKGLALEKNTKNWPDREFRWADRLGRLIQIFLESERQLTWTLWVCAYEDRDNQRYWRTKTLKKAVSIEQLQRNLSGDLEDGWREVTSWKSEDLYSAE